MSILISQFKPLPTSTKHKFSKHLPVGIPDLHFITMTRPRTVPPCMWTSWYHCFGVSPPYIFDFFEESKNRKWLRLENKREKRWWWQASAVSWFSLLPSQFQGSAQHFLAVPLTCCAYFHWDLGIVKKAHGSPLLEPRGKADRIRSLPSAEASTSSLVCSAGPSRRVWLADSLKLQARKSQATVHNRFQCIASDLNGTWPWGKMIQN